ncbi:hypothetical protein KFU94_35035 [Chloroflexi bacterium TSY]|nr:hypothetical protein [Chloroflexi bacterium TSY]
MSYINQQTLKTLSATYIQFAPHGDSAALTQNGNLISYTDIYDGDRPFLFDRRSGKKQLLPDTLSGAKIDPSGQWLIGRNREGALALTTLDGEEVRPLAQRKEGVRFKFLDWSADSSRILIGYIKASGSEMATIDVTSGSEVRRVALPFGDAALEMSAAFSPHGDQIAYDGPMGAARQWHVAVHSENETEATVVTAGAHNEALLGWDANPLGLMIARDHEGRWEAVRYTQTNDGCFAPTDCVKRPLGMVWQRQSNNWHGDYLYSAVDWQTNLYLVEIDESGVGLNKPISKISENLAWESRAEWFPNGQSILYAKGSGWGASRLQLVRWQNGQEEVITNLPGMMRFGGHSFEPRLAPEESAVIFQGRTTHGGEQDSAGIYSLDWQRSTISPIQQTTGLCPMNCLEWPTWVGVGLVAYTKWKNPWPSRSVVLHDLTTDTATAKVGYKK